MDMAIALKTRCLYQDLQQAIVVRRAAEIMRTQVLTSLEGLKVYYLFLRAYNNKRQQQAFRTKESVYEAIKDEANKVNKRLKKAGSRPFVSTHRNEIWKTITEIIRPAGVVVSLAPPLLRITYAEEKGLYPEVGKYLSSNGLKKTAKVFAPVSFLKLSLQEVEEIFQYHFGFGPLPYVSRLKETPSLVTMRREAQLLLSELILNNPEDVLFAFSKDDLEEHLKRRAKT